MNTINTRKKFFPNVTDEEWNDWTSVTVHIY